VRRRIVLPLLVPALLAVLAVPARADEPTATARAAATVLFQEGRGAAQSGDWPKACTKLKASFELDPAVGTLINLAGCLEHVGQLADAWNRFSRALGRLDPADPRVPVVQARIAALAPRLPRLTIVLAPDAPAGTAVRLDTAHLPGGALGTDLPVDPGSHVVVVTAPDRADRSYPVEIREAEQQHLAVAPGEPGKPAASSPPVAPPPVAPSGALPKPAGGLGPVRIAGIAVGSAGVVGLVTAIATGLVLPGKKSALAGLCNPTTKVCDAAGLSIAQEGQTLVTVNTVAWIAGGLATAAGIAMVIAGGEKRAHGTALTLRVLPDGAALGGRF
jgi:hypothetical protein